MSNQMAGEQFFVGAQVVDQCFDFVSATDLTSLTGTAVSSGTATQQSIANGVVRLSGVATTANTGYEYQETKGTVDFEAGSNHRVAGRFKLSTASLLIVLFGFAVVDTSLIASAPSDGVYLSKATGTTTINLIIRTGSSTVQTVAVDTADTSYHVYGLLIEPGQTPSAAQITVYKDGDVIHQANYTGLPDTALLAMSFAMQSGDTTGTQTVDLDFLRRRSTRLAN